MSRVIWKFPLEVTSGQTVTMPSDAVLLHVALQNGQPMLWALVDPENGRVMRSIFCVGTGQPMPIVTGPKYIGTTQHADGAPVFHWFSTPLI